LPCDGALAGFVGFLSMLKKWALLRGTMMVNGFVESVPPCIKAAQFYLPDTTR
jgi:hypothetical protein